MRISNDFHRELAAKHLRQLRPLAIIGAPVARVERVSKPVLPPERVPEAAVPSRRAFYEIDRDIDRERTLRTLRVAPPARSVRVESEKRPARRLARMSGRSKGRLPFRRREGSGRCGSVTRVRGQRAVSAIAIVEGALLHDRAIHATATTRAGRTSGTRRGHRIGLISRSVSTAARALGITARVAAAVEQSAAATAGRGQESKRNEKERETFHFRTSFRRGRRFSAA
jgi:hypothetical protein